MRIDFISDVACPWCAVGLHSLEKALDAIGGDIDVELHFQPFELNPDMPPEGADTVQYLSAKYGIDAAQIERNRAAIRERGAAVGFTFGDRPHVWNTFAAHRLLYWAGLQGKQRELKHALLEAYHGQARNPGARDVLVELAANVGLDPQEAGRVFDDEEYAAEVRAEQHKWLKAGIHSVPSIVIDERHLIQGGQPPEVFEQVLRRLAAQPGASKAPSANDAAAA